MSRKENQSLSVTRTNAKQSAEDTLLKQSQKKMMLNNLNKTTFPTGNDLNISNISTQDMPNPIKTNEQPMIGSNNPSLPITIIQTPNVNNISNYHNYNISNMTFNQEFGSG